MICYLCDHPHPKLERPDARYILELFKLCPTHKTEAEAKMGRDPGEDG